MFTHTSLCKIFYIAEHDATYAILHCSWGHDEQNNIAINQAKMKMMASRNMENMGHGPADNVTQNDAL